jgi:hypothetical protein
MFLLVLISDIIDGLGKGELSPFHPPTKKVANFHPWCAPYGWLDVRA